MKIFTFILAFIFVITVAHAQSYTLSWEGETLGDTVIIQGSPSGELTFQAVLTNNSADVDTIKIQRRLIELLPGTEHYFCWGSCYMPNSDSIFRPDGKVVLGPGDSSADWDFGGHYTPNMVFGTSLIEYTFYNKEDEDEQLTVVAMYVTSDVGISNNKLSNSIKVYPNPTEGELYINSQEKPDMLSIINILGDEILHLENPQTNNQINLSSLPPGIYFVKIKLESGTIVKKINKI